MKKKILNWGLLSTARINERLISPIRKSSRSKLLAVASRDLKSAKRFAKKFDIPNAYGSYEELLKVFWETHDPTTINQQGADIGSQYRSVVFYADDNQKKIAEKVLNDTNERSSGKIVTKISLLKNYCPAEEYHQKYLEKR